MITNVTDELSLEELDSQQGERLAPRQAMALLNLNLLVPINLGAALNVLTEGSDANALAGQLIPIFQQ